MNNFFQIDLRSMEVGVPVDAPCNLKNGEKIGPTPEIGLGLGAPEREEYRETNRGLEGAA